jgi:capsular polysaccharide biosynthesis protein
LKNSLPVSIQLKNQMQDQAEALNLLAASHLSAGRFEEAIICLQSALQKQPHVTLHYIDLLQQFAQQEQFDLVITLAIQALQINPVFDQAFVLIGYALQQQDREPEIAKLCGLGLLHPWLLQTYCSETTYQSIICSQLLSRDMPSLSSNQDKTGLKVFCIDGYPTGVTNLAQPQTLDTLNHKTFLNPQVATAPTFTVIVPKGRVWVDFYTRAVLSNDGSLVEDASVGNGALIASSQKLPLPVKVPGTIACLNVRYSQNYFHWMYDLLPKLGVLELAGIAIDDIDWFLVNSCQLPFQRELLHLIGVPDSKILDPTVYHAIVEKLIVPVSSFDAGRISPQSCKFLRRRLLTQVGQLLPTRIYISRKGANYRRLLNEEELMLCLQRYGFISVTLEALSVREQIAVFANAEVIISPHGAGLANIVFSQPSTKLIEIFMPDEVLFYYWQIASYIGLNYYYLLAEQAESSGQILSVGHGISMSLSVGDLVVNLNELQEILQLANIT